jgi:hypothetical protein
VGLEFCELYKPNSDNSVLFEKLVQFPVQSVPIRFAILYSFFVFMFVHPLTHVYLITQALTGTESVPCSILPKPIILSLTEQSYIVTHTIRQTEILALLDSWIKTHILSKCFIHKKMHFPYIFVNNVLKCWTIKAPSSFFCLL